MPAQPCTYARHTLRIAANVREVWPELHISTHTLATGIRWMWHSNLTEVKASFRNYVRGSCSLTQTKLGMRLLLEGNAREKNTPTQISGHYNCNRKAGGHGMVGMQCAGTATEPKKTPSCAFWMFCWCLEREKLKQHQHHFLKRKSTRFLNLKRTSARTVFCNSSTGTEYHGTMALRLRNLLVYMLPVRTRVYIERDMSWAFLYAFLAFETDNFWHRHGLKICHLVSRQQRCSSSLVRAKTIRTGLQYVYDTRTSTR